MKQFARSWLDSVLFDSGFGLYDNQLSVISKSSQGGGLDSQSGYKWSQEWQVCQ